MNPCPNIDQLCNLLDERMIRVAPTDTEMHDRWMGDYALYREEGFLPAPYRDEDSQLIKSALREWNEREQIMLGALKMKNHEFYEWFDKELKVFISSKSHEYYPGTLFSRACICAKEMVFNISWLNTFIFFLPRYAPKEYMSTISACALSISTIFYMEKIDRSIIKHDAGAEPQSLDRVYSCWKYAKEMYNKNTGNTVKGMP